MDKSEAANVFAMIFNIPSSYHSSTLRNFFGELTEGSSFKKFHYRHQPMQKNGSSPLPTDSNTKASPQQHHPACCCVVLCQLSCFTRLQAAYHLHHWKDEEGNNHPTQCFIYPINCILDDSDEVTDLTLSPDFAVTTHNHTDSNENGKLYMPYKDILEFKEMRPPDIMPQGNIGTPTSHFLDLINSCRLPPVIVKKLGLKFKKQGGKFYTTVPYEYNSEEKTPSTLTEDVVTGPAVTALRHKILDHSEYAEEKLMQHRVRQNLERNKPHKKLQADQDTASTSRHIGGGEESDGETEEWDRHEAFHDDPTNYERNKERLYEEKIELKWEKGGSGLVFYTDAQYWKQLEGDFDEQTTDDWDVDMSEYYEPGTGDKDSRDYIRMRAEDRLRGDLANLQELSGYDQPIGSFERYTKGVGRTVLEKHGWRDGQGAGVKEAGRAHIIDTDGQHPRDKSGFGFHGERVARFIPPGSRKRRTDEPIISTIYDDPQVTDEPDSLLERSNPHNIKHRTRHVN